MPNYYCIRCGEEFTSVEGDEVLCPKCRRLSEAVVSSDITLIKPPELSSLQITTPMEGSGTLVMEEQRPSPPLKEYKPEDLTRWEEGQVIAGLYKVKGSAEGGMGVVYFVDHLKWRIPLAVKTPLPEIVADEISMKRFIREAEVWIDLGLHPHIVTCFYVRQIGGLPRIFMEYVDGGSLKDWIRDGRVKEWKDILDLAIQFCRGMEYAHRKGVIHRDIKPANCLMTRDGTLKITDFGLVKAIGIREIGDAVSVIGQRLAVEGGSLTIGGGIVGTPEYMAPEQFEGAKELGREADIYSFGVMLFEMVCGRRPFIVPDSVHPYARIFLYKEKHLKEIPPEPISLRQDCPKRLNDLILKCLTKDPERRREHYPSFEAIRKELEDLYEEIVKEPYPREMIEEIELRADSLNNRGVSYLDLNREKEAVKCWQEALKVDPQHLQANFNLGYLRWLKGEITIDDYVVQMREIEGGNKNNPEYWLCLGWIHYERGDVEAIERIQNSENRIEDEGFLKALQDKERPVGKHLKTFEGHTEMVTSVTFSPEGRYALSGSSDKTLRLWDVASGKEIRRFEGHTWWVNSVTFSPDGRYALSGGWDGTIRLWDVISGREIRRFKGHAGRVTSVIFSPDGRYALSGGDDETLRLWDVASGREIRRFEGHTRNVTSVTFSPDGRYALSGSYDKTLRLWDVASGREIRRFEGHTDEVISVTFSPDGRYALSGSVDKTLRLWDVANGREIRRFKGHTDIVWSVTFSPDGRYALSGSEDKTIRLWDVARGREIRRFEGHTWTVTSVTFSPDGRYALSGSMDRTLRLWEVYFPQKDWGESHPFPLLCRVKSTATLSEERQKIKSLMKSVREFMEKGSFNDACILIRQGQSIPGYERDKELLTLLTLCGIRGKGKRIGLRNAWPLSTFKGHTDIVWSVTFSPDGRYALSGGRDKTIRLWDVASGREIRRFEGHYLVVYSVTFSPDGRYALSGNNDGTLRLWDMASGREIRRFEGHIFHVTSVTFSPDGRYALSGSGDKTLRLWDVANGREIRRFKGHTDIVWSVTFSPDGRYALSGSEDKTIRLWDVARGREIRRFEGHTWTVTSVTFSPDGRYALSGSGDWTIRLWDVASGREIRRFEGHTSSVTSVTFSPDGRYALSGSHDWTIRLWDVASGREIWRFEGHTESVESVTFSPDGRYALSGSEDKTLRLWEFDWEWEF